MAKNLTTGLQRGLRQSIAGGLGTGDLFSIASLDLQFARHKSLDSRVTHTRQSSATYVDGDGVIRTAVTNLLLQSEDFSTTWTLQGSATVTKNLTVAPDGQTTADTLNTLGSGIDVVSGSVTVTQSATVTGSIYVKTGGTTPFIRFQIYAGGADGFRVWVNNSTGAVGTPKAFGTGTVTSASSTSVGNGWFRIAISGTCGTSTSPIMAFAGANVDGGFSRTSGQTYILWGAQLEQSSTVGQYVKTTTAINSAPRFDHDPETGESLGLLVEESRTNLIGSSNTFSTAAATQTVDADVAPDGTTTAVKVVSAGGGVFKASIPVTNGSTVTYSVFLKAVSGSNILTSVGFERFGATTINGSVKVNLNDATLSNIGSDVVSSSIKEYGNGWYRVSVTATAVNSTANIINYSNAGPCTFLVWGMQMETGSFPTSYIPTEGSTVTRAADVASITGTNFSSWYNDSEGTVFSYWQTQKTDDAGIYDFNDGTNTTIIWNWVNSSNLIHFRYRVSGLNQFNTTSIANPLTLTKTIQSYKQDDFAACVNGSTVLTDTSGTPTNTINKLELGVINSSNLLSGTISRLTYWPTRLSNDTLQTITQ